MKKIKIAFYGNFGAGNLGNECTLQATLEYARRRWPDARLLCFCTEPEDVKARHGIEAMPAMATTIHWSWTAFTQQSGSASPAVSARPRGAPGRLLRMPLRLLKALFVRVPRELAHWAKVAAALSRCNILIVGGTGIVTDICGTLQWPYDMFRLSLLAALLRVRVLWISVGVGPIRAPASRWLLRKALGMASYRSYRDRDSKQCMQGIGLNTAADLVYPDLVFGLSPGPLPARQDATSRTPVLGLGLKDYSAGGGAANTYRDYLDAMATFVLWLKEHGWRTRLLIGDAQYDSQVRLDLLEEVRRRNSAAAAWVLIDPVPTVEELLRQLTQTDAVISPRFHNLVLGLILNKPVIALSDMRKVEVLMSDLGLPQYCLSMDKVDAPTLIQRFSELEKDAERLRFYIKEKVDRLHEAVDQQYASVFDGAPADRQAAVSPST